MVVEMPKWRMKIIRKGYVLVYCNEKFWNNRVSVVNELIKAEILVSPCEFNGLIAPGSFGNYLSFRKLFRHAMKKYDQILVAEDDVVFHPNFKELFWKAYKQVENDTTWDFIFVGISRFKYVVLILLIEKGATIAYHLLRSMFGMSRVMSWKVLHLVPMHLLFANAVCNNMSSMPLCQCVCKVMYLWDF